MLNFQMIKRSSIALIALGSLYVSSVHSATLAGDQVFVELEIGGISDPIVVGAGLDYEIGSFDFDFNAGVNGDELLFSDFGGSLNNSSFLLFSSLDFDDGSSLQGFRLISTSLSNLMFSLTEDSIRFNFDAVLQGPNNGPAISGRFITNTSAVPIPAAFWLFGTALVGLLGFKKRQAKIIA